MRTSTDKLKKTFETKYIDTDRLAGGNFRCQKETRDDKKISVVYKAIHAKLEKQGSVPVEGLRGRMEASPFLHLHIVKTRNKLKTID